MSRYANIVASPVPQTEQADPAQVRNHEGGFSFVLDDFKRLERFLILGSDSNTYYQGARELTLENAACVTRCFAKAAHRAAEIIANVSKEGRAPKNAPAQFALAIGATYDEEERIARRAAAAGNVLGDNGAAIAEAQKIDQRIRAAALARLSDVCRTGTHLFEFVEFTKVLAQKNGRKNMRRSAAFKRAIAKWLNSKRIDHAALQIVKYRSRAGWTVGDVMKIAHPAAADGIDANQTEQFAARKATYQWARGVKHEEERLPDIIRAHVDAMKTENVAEIIWLAEKYRLPREAIPTKYLKDPNVQRALLPHMGATALIRNLGSLTASGVIAPLSDETRYVFDKLTDIEYLRRGRVHPFNVMLARHVYAGGKALSAGRFSRRADGTEREVLTWKPDQMVLTALEDAFIKSFKVAVPSGKRHLIGVDVSASMTSERIMNSPMTAHQAAAVMGLVALKIEPWAHVMAFDHGIRDVGIKATSTLEDVERRTRALNGGGTDCSLPMQYALSKRIPVDVFCIYTDNETRHGRIHPHVALKQYRDEMKIDAKLIVVGFTATNFTIADQNDPGMLDVVGFDSAAPAVMADFARGGGATLVTEDDDEQ